MNLTELQEAIVARLGAVTAITDTLGVVPGAYQTHAIYTRVPQSINSEDNAPFPFVTVSIVAPSAFDTKTDTGADVTIDVHVWSRGNTLAAPLAIADAIYDALHRHDLTVSGANVVNCLFENGAMMMDPDGVTVHLIRSFRVTYFLT